MPKLSHLVLGITGSVLAAALGLLLAEPAGAQCRNVWAPSPEGGQLILICDGNTGSGGSGGGGGGPEEKKPKKPPPQFGAIALNPVPVDGVYSGATSAGYLRKGKARSRALRACTRATGGACVLKAITARNGWAVLVGALATDGLPRFFAGTGKTHVAAQRAAERRTEEALGASRAGPIELVVGVDSRARERR